MAPLSRYPLSPLNPNRSQHPSLFHHKAGSPSAHLSKPAKRSQSPAVPNPKPLNPSVQIIDGRENPKRLSCSAAAPAALHNYHDGLQPHSYCSRNPNYRSVECHNLTKKGEVHSASPNYVIVNPSYQSKRRMSRYGSIFTCNADEGILKHDHGVYKRSTSLGGACRTLKYNRHESSLWNLSCDYHDQSLSLDEHIPMQSLYSLDDDEGSTLVRTCLSYDNSTNQRKSKLSGSKSFKSTHSSKSKYSSLNESKEGTFSGGKVEQRIEKELREQVCKKTPCLKSPQIPSHLLQDPCLDAIIDRAWHYHNVGEPLSPYTRITLCNHLSSFSSRKPCNSMWATRLKRLVSWRL